MRAELLELFECTQCTRKQPGAHVVWERAPFAVTPVGSNGRSVCALPELVKVPRLVAAAGTDCQGWADEGLCLLRGLGFGVQSRAEWNARRKAAVRSFRLGLGLQEALKGPMQRSPFERSLQSSGRPAPKPPCQFGPQSQTPPASAVTAVTRPKPPPHALPEPPRDRATRRSKASICTASLRRVAGKLGSELHRIAAPRSLSQEVAPKMLELSSTSSSIMLFQSPKKASRLSACLQKHLPGVTCASKEAWLVTG